MARQTRQLSATDIYHITARGSGKRRLFENDDDREFLLDRIQKYAIEFEATLFAWCLMDNHYHLLMKVAAQDLSPMMHSLNTSYAHYFNGAHGHVGIVFQNRFGSKPVEEEDHFLEVIRYIHLNPRDIGVENFWEYPWSSYSQYAGGSGFCNVGLMLAYFGNEEAFFKFHKTGPERPELPDPCPARPYISDAEAVDITTEALGELFVDRLTLMSKEERNRSLSYLYEKGISIRQLGRLTGIGKTIIQCAVENASSYQGRG